MDPRMLAFLVAIARANGSNPDEAVAWSERVAAIYDEAAKEAEPPVIDEPQTDPTPPPAPAPVVGDEPQAGPISPPPAA